MLLPVFLLVEQATVYFVALSYIVGNINGLTSSINVGLDVLTWFCRASFSHVNLLLKAAAFLLKVLLSTTGFLCDYK